MSTTLTDGTQRTVVVTGVTSGIGEALAARLAGRFRVLGIGRSEERLAAGARRHGFVPITCDLARPDERQQAIAEIVGHCEGRGGRLAALVNNAAECVYQTPTGLDEGAWHHLMQVNLLAAVHLVAGLAARLQGGRLVNVSSVVTRHLPAARFGPYAVSKAALEEWTRAVRLELAPHDVGVTLVAPGLVDTPIYGKVAGAEALQARMREQVPVWLGAADVAEAVAWILEQPARVVVAELVLLPRGQAR
jgi:NAD(P)-dependent dehydrogenase (short-subunit alcohol dehydrogenase family)